MLRAFVFHTLSVALAGKLPRPEGGFVVLDCSAGEAETVGNLAGLAVEAEELVEAAITEIFRDEGGESRAGHIVFGLYWYNVSINATSLIYPSDLLFLPPLFYSLAEIFALHLA